MTSSPWVQIYTARSILCSPMPSQFNGLNHSKISPPQRCLNKRSRFPEVKCANERPASASASDRKSHIAVIFDIPKIIWNNTLRPLADFGVGKRSVWEGGVGMFVASGAVMLALGYIWMKGLNLGSPSRRYRAVLEFSQACGLSLGTPVRIRGVSIGSVVTVNASLNTIDAIVEVENDKIIIPRNALVEINQSGLLMETLIDITPQHPLPTPSVGPLDPDCVREGLIVCDRERIKGREGVSLDALIGILTRLSQETEQVGISRSYSLAERVAAVIQEAQPLIAKIEAMSEDIQPMLSEVRSSSLLGDITSLTKKLTEGLHELRSTQSSADTDQDAKTFSDTVKALIMTLKNIEGITSDVSDITSDEGTKRNIKLLIKSLSRLM